MTNKYIFALDLDGTLLKDDKTISGKTKRYLHKLEKQGHYVIISSGRAPRSIYKFKKELKNNSPYLGYNGIIAQDPSKTHFDSIEYKLNKDVIKKVYKDLLPYTKSTMSESFTQIFCDKKNDFLLRFFNPDGMKFIVGDLSEIINEDPFIYIFEIDNPEVNKPLISKYFEGIDGYEVRFWYSAPYGEIYKKGISKSSTLKQIAHHLNVDENHILAFGDADNDAEVLKDITNSFAMINGQPSIKKIAKYVTKKDNNHDGVMHAIKDFLKEHKN